MEDKWEKRAEVGNKAFWVIAPVILAIMISYMYFTIE
jgi:hypothetical protein